MEIIVTTPDELQKFIEKTLSKLLLDNNASKPPFSKPLTVEQAAAYLNVPKATLYQLTSKLEIPFRKIGRRLTFLPEELDNWLRDNRRKTRSEIENQTVIRPGKEMAKWKR